MKYNNFITLLLICSNILCGCINQESKSNVSVNKQSSMQQSKLHWKWLNQEVSLTTNTTFQTVIRFSSSRPYKNNPDFIIDIQKKDTSFFIQVQEYTDSGFVVHRHKQRDIIRSIKLLSGAKFKNVYESIMHLPIKTITNRPLDKDEHYHDIWLGYEFYDKGYHKEINFNKPFSEKLWRLTNDILKISKFKTKEAKNFVAYFVSEFKKKYP